MVNKILQLKGIDKNQYLLLFLYNNLNIYKNNATFF